MEALIMSVNKAIVVGNLGRDPEVRALPSGQSVASFSIATTARFKDRSPSSAPNGIAWSRSEGSPITASACLPKGAGLR
jgi:single-strand DNA-binding protein